MKAETRGLKKAFFGKTSIGHRSCYFSIVSGRIKWDLDRFSIPNFQAYGCFERKTSVSHRLCSELLFLNTCNLKQILTMIITINYFRSPFLFALISMRGMTFYNLILPPSSRFFALQVIWGSLVSAAAYLLSLKARNSMNFQPICKILVSNTISKS